MNRIERILESAKWQSLVAAALCLLGAILALWSLLL
jgi:hypothetical protein